MGTDIHPIVEVKVDETWTRVLYEPEAIHSRNYDLFALLANVRNGIGFAGIKMGEGWKPLSDPRGLPSDMNPYNDYDLGDHSFSYATLKELIEFFNIEQISRKYGVISILQYKSYIKGTRPSNYSGGIIGQNIITINEQYIEGIIDYGRNVDIYIQVSWLEKSTNAVNHFINEVIPWMESLGEPENVRLVFGFDS